ncbi:hypothetical protein T484DRAFT_1984601 [Baffinella frigidus]|nr:hypothetical protein T484DRAFT_1984601 [Cryptophyta sp. CCMP2293]
MVYSICGIYYIVYSICGIVYMVYTPPPRRPVDLRNQSLEGLVQEEALSPRQRGVLGPPPYILNTILSIYYIRRAWVAGGCIPYIYCIYYIVYTIYARRPPEPKPRGRAAKSSRGTRERGSGGV